MKKLLLFIFFLSVSCNIYSQYYLNNFDFEKILFTSMNLRMLNIKSICKKEYNQDSDYNMIENGYHCIYLDSNGSYKANIYYDKSGKEISKSLNLKQNNKVDIILTILNNGDTLWGVAYYENEKNNQEFYTITSTHLIKSHYIYYTEPGLYTSQIIFFNSIGDTSVKVNLKFNGFGQPVEEIDYMFDTVVVSASVCEYDKNNKISKIFSRDYLENSNIEQNFEYDSQGLPIKQYIYKNEIPFKSFTITYNTNIDLLYYNENLKIDSICYNFDKVKSLPYLIKKYPRIQNDSLLRNLLMNNKDIIVYCWDKNKMDISFNYTIDKLGHAKDVELIINGMNPNVKNRIENLIKDFIIGEPAISGYGLPIEIPMFISWELKKGRKKY